MKRVMKRTNEIKMIPDMKMMYEVEMMLDMNEIMHVTR